MVVASLAHFALAMAGDAHAADPDSLREVAVRLRWAEAKPVKGLTVQEGIDLSCTDGKAYLHARPVVSQDDITEVTLTEVPAGREKKYFLVFRLTRAAAKEMERSSAVNEDKPLVVEVDGKVVAAMVAKTKLGDTVPITGYFSEQEALRIGKGIRPRGSGQL
jgi:preprotein translocase subunit SecD